MMNLAKSTFTNEDEVLRHLQEKTIQRMKAI